MNIKPEQAAIIFQALGYVANEEGLELSEELQKVYTVLGEHNPNDGDVIDIIDIMEALAPILKEEYKDCFEEKKELYVFETSPDQYLISLEVDGKEVHKERVNGYWLAEQQFMSLIKEHDFQPTDMLHSDEIEEGKTVCTYAEFLEHNEGDDE